MKSKFNIVGMHCASCSANVEKAISKTQGVNSVSVNLITNSAVVDFDDKKISEQQIVLSVQKAGFDASVAKDNTLKNPKEEFQKELNAMKGRLSVSLIFFAIIMYVSMGHMIGLYLPKLISPDSNFLNFAILQFVLTIPVLIVNRQYFISGIKSFFNKNPNMDTLITIGSLSAFLYSIYATVMHLHNDLYYESTVTILTLITLGKFLETRSKKKTGDAISKLIEMAPKTARVIRNNEEITLDIDEIVVGDIVVVRPGEKIPTDGEIISGETTIDESSLTGESMPVSKLKGESVITATLNITGAFQYKASEVGENTVFAKIIKLVEEASSSKAPISNLADKISSVFVPVVMVISLISFVVWLFLGQSFSFALSIAICVLVISCPCALGLATPVAIMVGTGVGASKGILIKSAQYLQKAHEIKTIVFDKTGTLTKGEISVTDISYFDISENEFLKIAFSLEKMSEHPIGKAIVNYCVSKNIDCYEIDNFKAVLGRGVECVINNSQYFAGNKEFILQNNIDIIDIKNEKIGETPIYIAKENRAIGVIFVSDTIKENVADSIIELNKMGIKTVMLTGDNEKTAYYIAQKAGIKKENVISQVMPQDKEMKIRELQKDGVCVAMVGDGINDAPALTRADVGIAIGGGTQIASEAADIVLMQNDISRIKDTILLSKRTINNIKINLFWAFFYNIIGIPIAAGVFYYAFSLKLNPMIASVAMSLSSLCVVANALTLAIAKKR